MHYKYDPHSFFRLIFIVQAAPTTLEDMVLMESRRGAEYPATAVLLYFCLGGR